MAAANASVTWDNGADRNVLSLAPAVFNPSELSVANEWQKLSDGGYSEVYRARLLGAPVAVKAATARKKTSGESLMRELRYLHQTGPHPNIVQVYGAFSDCHGKLHLVLELARHCLRSDRIAQQCDAVFVLAGVARALVRIHSMDIVHRDLKTRNILVAAENRALVIDFGLACHVREDSAQWIARTVGTKKYRPPEMREGRPAHGAMDMFCYGLMIEKLLRQRRGMGESPCSDAGRHERRDSKLLQDISQQCVNPEPPARPTAWSVLLRLQHHMGEETARCDSVRHTVPLLSTPHLKALASCAAEIHDCEPLGEDRGGNGNMDADGSCNARHAQGCKRRRPGHRSGSKEDDAVQRASS